MAGYENPFIRGMMGARQQNEQSAMNDLRQQQGILSIQQAMTQRDQMAKDEEFKGLFGARLAAGDMEGAKTIAMQYKPELFAQSLVPKAPEWSVTERFNDQTGRPEKVLMNKNDPTQVMPFGGQKAPTLSFGPDGVARDMSTVQPGTVANDPSKLIALGPDGQPRINQLALDARRQISAAGASRNTTNVNMPGDNKYIDTRRAGQATAFGDLEKAAQSAYNQFSTLDRFIQASEKGFAGGAAPVLAGVTNFLSSFGYNSEALKDTRVMEQAIGDILGNKMAELGARGLTDKDMQILRDALPRVETDKKSRVEIAKIIKKANANTLREYENARQEEARIYPQLADRTPNPAWYKDYKSNPQRFGISPAGVGNVPSGVDPKVWAVMTPEERALWK